MDQTNITSVLQDKKERNAEINTIYGLIVDWEKEAIALFQARKNKDLNLLCKEPEKIDKKDSHDSREIVVKEFPFIFHDYLLDIDVNIQRIAVRPSVQESLSLLSKIIWIIDYGYSVVTDIVNSEVLRKETVKQMMPIEEKYINISAKLSAKKQAVFRLYLWQPTLEQFRLNNIDPQAKDSR
jgi:hypothetical protein